MRVVDLFGVPAARVERGRIGPRGGLCYEMPALHLVYAIDHLGSGGAQRQAVELALHFARGGLRVSFLVYHAADFFAPRLAGSPVRVVRIPKRAKLDLGFPRRLARWLAEERPDVVHAFLLAPALWSLLAVRRLPRARRPAFLVGERNTRIAEGALERAVQRYTYRRADAVTANSALAARLVRERLAVPAARVHYVPNGIDLAAWDAGRDRSCPLELVTGRLNLAVIGRLEPQKGHRLVLDALARLGAARAGGLAVWFVGAESGGGAYPAALREEVARRGLADVVRMAPPVREVAALMARLDALLLPSEREGFPNVLLEAMASGLPAVATRVGDVPNMLVDGESGLLVEAGDAAGLARALETLLGMAPEARAALGRRAREVVEKRYQLAAVAEQYLALYRALAAARPAAR
jgi:glycosyltransferase involved in cell wall biosynthesis